MNDHAHPIFSDLLNRMSGNAMSKPTQQYQKVAALTDHITIRVPKVELTIRPRGAAPGDDYFDRTGTLDAHLTQRAYELLVEAFPDVFEAIATRLAKGEIK